MYKGLRNSDGRAVAIKRVEIFDMAAKKRERCLKEVQLLKDLSSHPHILELLEAFIDENQLIIVTEWAPGGDLKRFIKRTSEQGRTLDESEIWNYFFQVLNHVDPTWL